MPKPQSPACSFCARTHEEVRKLIAGPGVYICDSCIVVCGRILAKELPEPGAPPPRKAQVVFQTDAAETQASLKILKGMKRDKAISADEFIALSRRLITGMPNECKPPTKAKSAAPATKKRVKAAGK